MVRYRSKSGKYSLGKRYKPKYPYHILNLYKRSNIYRPRIYKGGAGMRRGYSSGLYSPSRGMQSYQGQSSAYSPKPRQSSQTGNPRPWTETKHYELPRIRVEPDTEQMIKQLEKRFDEKLHEQVLEKLEAEFEKLKETLYKERAEREELEEKIMRENEAFLEEHKDELIDKLLIGDMDNPEVGSKEKPQVNDSAKSETKAETENIESADSEEKLEAKQGETEGAPADIGTKEAEKGSEVETLDNELYDKDLEWLRELDESPPEINEENKLLEQSPEMSEGNETIEPEQTLEPTSESIEELASQESMEKPEMEVSEADALENPVEIGAEQLQDLEPILDQIEPIEPEEIKPIEKGIEIAPEILPENIEKEPLEEGEAY